MLVNQILVNKIKSTTHANLQQLKVLAEAAGDGPDAFNTAFRQAIIDNQAYWASDPDSIDFTDASFDNNDWIRGLGGNPSIGNLRSEAAEKYLELKLLALKGSEQGYTNVLEQIIQANDGRAVRESLVKDAAKGLLDIDYSRGFGWDIEQDRIIRENKINVIKQTAAAALFRKQLTGYFQQEVKQECLLAVSKAIACADDEIQLEAALNTASNQEEQVLKERLGLSDAFVNVLKAGWGNAEGYQKIRVQAAFKALIPAIEAVDDDNGQRTGLIELAKCAEDAAFKTALKDGGAAAFLLGMPDSENARAVIDALDAGQVGELRDVLTERLYTLAFKEYENTFDMRGMALASNDGAFTKALRRSLIKLNTGAEARVDLNPGNNDFLRKRLRSNENPNGAERLRKHIKQLSSKYYVERLAQIPVENLKSEDLTVLKAIARAGSKGELVADLRGLGYQRLPDGGKLYDGDGSFDAAQSAAKRKLIDVYLQPKKLSVSQLINLLDIETDGGFRDAVSAHIFGEGQQVITPQVMDDVEARKTSIIKNLIERHYLLPQDSETDSDYLERIKALGEASDLEAFKVLLAGAPYHFNQSAQDAVTEPCYQALQKSAAHHFLLEQLKQTVPGHGEAQTSIEHKLNLLRSIVAQGEGGDLSGIGNEPNAREILGLADEAGPNHLIEQLVFADDEFKAARESVYQQAAFDALSCQIKLKLFDDRATAFAHLRGLNQALATQEPIEPEVLNNMGLNGGDNAAICALLNGPGLKARRDELRQKVNTALLQLNLSDVITPQSQTRHDFFERFAQLPLLKQAQILGKVREGIDEADVLHPEIIAQNPAVKTLALSYDRFEVRRALNALEFDEHEAAMTSSLIRCNEQNLWFEQIQNHEIARALRQTGIDFELNDAKLTAVNALFYGGPNVAKTPQALVGNDVAGFNGFIDALGQALGVDAEASKVAAMRAAFGLNPTGDGYVDQVIRDKIANLQARNYDLFNAQIDNDFHGVEKQSFIGYLLTQDTADGDALPLNDEQIRALNKAFEEARDYQAFKAQLTPPQEGNANVTIYRQNFTIARLPQCLRHDGLEMLAERDFKRLKMRQKQLSYVRDRGAGRDVRTLSKLPQDVLSEVSVKNGQLERRDTKLYQIIKEIAAYDKNKPMIELRVGKPAQRLATVNKGQAEKRILQLQQLATQLQQRWLAMSMIHACAGKLRDANHVDGLKDQSSEEMAALQAEIEQVEQAEQRYVQELQRLKVISEQQESLTVHFTGATQATKERGKYVSEKELEHLIRKHRGSQHGVRGESIEVGKYQNDTGENPLYHKVEQGAAGGSYEVIDIKTGESPAPNDESAGETTYAKAILVKKTDGSRALIQSGFPANGTDAEKANYALHAASSFLANRKNPPSKNSKLAPSAGNAEEARYMWAACMYLGQKQPKGLGWGPEAVKLGAQFKFVPQAGKDYVEKGVFSKTVEYRGKIAQIFNEFDSSASGAYQARALSQSYSDRGVKVQDSQIQQEVKKHYEDNRALMYRFRNAVKEHEGRGKVLDVSSDKPRGPGSGG